MTHSLTIAPFLGCSESPTTGTTVNSQIFHWFYEDLMRLSDCVQANSEIFHGVYWSCWDLIRLSGCIQGSSRSSELWDLPLNLMGYHEAQWLHPSQLKIEWAWMTFTKPAGDQMGLKKLESIILYIWKKKYREEQNSPMKFKEFCRTVCTCNVDVYMVHISVLHVVQADLFILMTQHDWYTSFWKLIYENHLPSMIQ